MRRIIRSMDIFKELTFKETSTTTTILDVKIFNIYLGDFRVLSLSIYIYVDLQKATS